MNDCHLFPPIDCQFPLVEKTVQLWRECWLPFVFKASVDWNFNLVAAVSRTWLEPFPWIEIGTQVHLGVLLLSRAWDGEVINRFRRRRPFSTFDTASTLERKLRDWPQTTMNVHKSPADFTTHHKKGTVNSVDCLKLVVSWVERILTPKHSTAWKNSAPEKTLPSTYLRCTFSYLSTG